MAQPQLTEDEKEYARELMAQGYPAKSILEAIDMRRERIAAQGMLYGTSSSSSGEVSPFEDAKLQLLQRKADSASAYNRMNPDVDYGNFERADSLAREADEYGRSLRGR